MAAPDAASTTNRRRRPLVRVVRLVGNVLLVVGVIALVWTFVIWRWGDPATALYTRWQQHRLQSELAVLERRYESRPLEASAPTTVVVTPATRARARAEAKRAARQLRATTRPGDPLGRIRVPRLGLNMIFVDGTDHESLKRGPGADRRAAIPGEGELVYIAGHRTTFGAPFARIDRMRKGDLIELDMPYGTYTYRVTNWVIVPASDLARLGSRGRDEVALQACHPRFSARQRYIVYALPAAARTR